MADVFTLTSEAIPSSARVLGFRGSEAISTPYRFDIAFSLMPGVDLDMTAAIGARATLSISRDVLAPPYLVSGVLSAIELVYEYADRAVFLATLSPRVERLALTRHSRVFVERSVVDILTEVLAQNGLSSPGDFELDLARRYPRRDHVSQYKESDLAFLSRLMERDGIYYFFRQEPEKDVLVITDHKSAHVPSRAAPARYVALNPGDTASQEAFGTFRCRVTALAGRTVERDYDYLRPRLDIRGAAAASPADEQVVVWGETAKSTEGAQAHATIEAEALRARQARYTATGRVFDMRSGHTFELDEHPRAPLNRAYLATAVEHEGNDSGGAKDIEDLLQLDKMELYRVTVEAIPADLQFRSPRRTPWPRIEGIVEGVVDGAAESPYAQIDEHGRYHVRIFFDENDSPDGKASMWVRMIQPHGGNPEGFHFPLRKGTEVAIVFLGGDPDRPAIVGAVPNPLNPSVVTSANASQNVVMTGGSNRLEMEDQAGGQYVTLTSPTLKSRLHLGAGPYSFVGYTDGNGLNHYGQNLDVEVLADKTEEVTGSVRETYHDTTYTIVHSSVDKEYLDTFDLTVTGKTTEVFKNWLDTSVSQGARLYVGQTYDETVDGAVSRKYGATLTEEVTGLVSLTHKSGRTADITTSDHVNVTGTQTITVSGQQTFEGGSQLIKSNGDQVVEVTGAQVNNVGAHQTNTKGPFIVYSGPMFEGWSDGDFKLTAAGGSGLVSAHATLNLQASAEIVATAVNITVAAGGTVNISGGGTVNIRGGTVKLN